MMTRLVQLATLLVLAVTVITVNAATPAMENKNSNSTPSIAKRDAYRVQVGDVVRIVLPGEDTLDKNFNVDRQGRIVLPEVGAVKVVGVSEQEMEEKIREQLKMVFRDLGNLRVFIKERRVLVNVLGYVKKPGEINLTSSAGIQMALRKAGGLRAGAQLDKMQLRRGKKTLTFNYKDYLDSGDEALLPKMRSLDVIFVPASPKIGNIEVNFDPAKMTESGDAAGDRNAIKVFGEVNSPGSFSYKKSITLVDLLMRSGGVTRYAGVEQIRLITKGQPKLFNLKEYLDTGDEKLLPKIIPGTTVFVPRQEEEIKAGRNIVYIMGEVAKPGAFEGKKGATFMDILANAGGPTRYAETRQIRIIKADGKIKPFDLAAYTEGTFKGKMPKIEPGDAIFLPEKVDINEKSWLKVSPNRAVRVLGEVVRPGRYEWGDEMSLLDLLAHAGGPTSRADTANIEILTPRKGKNKVYRFNLDTFIKNGGKEKSLPKIVAGATIRVHDLPQDPSDNKSQWVRQSKEHSIYIFGQVGAPGRYRFTEEMGFLDILSAADGPNGNADIHNIRISHRNGGYAKVTKLDLGLYFETGDDHLIPQVKPGDTIYIPEKNRMWLNKTKESTVRVLGAINKPGRYRFNDDMTLLDLLAEAGGPSATAYIKKITVVNLSCCKDQARTFDLAAFSKSGNFSKLPVLRSGDTVYIPSQQESTLYKVRTGLKDVMQVVSMVALFGLI